MKHEFLLNGKVTLLLIPENPMEEQILKQLLKAEVEVKEIRAPVTVLGQVIKTGVVISQDSKILAPEDVTTKA